MCLPLAGIAQSPVLPAASRRASRPSTARLEIFLDQTSSPARCRSAPHPGSAELLVSTRAGRSRRSTAFPRADVQSPSRLAPAPLRRVSQILRRLERDQGSVSRARAHRGKSILPRHRKQGRLPFWTRLPHYRCTMRKLFSSLRLDIPSYSSVAHVGTAVSSTRPLLTLHARSERGWSAAARSIRDAVTIGDALPDASPVIRARRSSGPSRGTAA